MSWGHSDGYVVLQTPMNGPVVEAAYGRTMIHSTKVVVEMLAWEEWLGCHYDTSPMVDIPRSTLVWAPYMIFSCFHDIKIYMYYVFKSICIIKRTLVVSDFVLAWQYSKKVFDCPWVLKKRLIHRYTVVLLRVDIMYCYVYDTTDLFKSFFTPSSLNLVGFRYFFLHWARGFAHTLLFPFLGCCCHLLHVVVVNSLICFSSRWSLL